MIKHRGIVKQTDPDKEDKFVFGWYVKAWGHDYIMEEHRVDGHDPAQGWIEIVKEPDRLIEVLSNGDEMYEGDLLKVNTIHIGKKHISYGEICWSEIESAYMVKFPPETNADSHLIFLSDAQPFKIVKDRKGTSV